MEQCPDNYFEEIVPGKDYQTKLPSVQGLQTAQVNPGDPAEQSAMLNESILNSTCGGLSHSDLQLLEVGRISHKVHKASDVAVWAQDDISPASYILSYKKANAILNWTP
jgi:hypothetical protein